MISAIIVSEAFCAQVRRAESLASIATARNELLLHALKIVEAASRASVLQDPIGAEAPQEVCAAIAPGHAVQLLAAVAAEAFHALDAEGRDGSDEGGADAAADHVNLGGRVLKALRSYDPSISDTVTTWLVRYHSLTTE